MVGKGGPAEGEGRSPREVACLRRLQGSKVQSMTAAQGMSKERHSKGADGRVVGRYQQPGVVAPEGLHLE
ncbi:MAG: hypothetical protein H6Q51_2557, partial [Deltaproteobacteria bacterium]|nr:hypothetical protein [Deltaproteobacteria bacterium]